MTNIIESFQKQVLLTPDRDAVCFKEQKLTYRELDDLSDIPPTAIIREFIGGSKIVD